jgi:hypothetical protein
LVWRSFFRDNDVYHCMRDFQTFIDLLDGKAKPDWQKILRESKKVNEKLEKAGISLMVSKMLNTTLDGVLEKLAAAQTLRNLTVTAIAIRRYELAHGGVPPDNLEGLVPEHLKNVPHDAIGGGSLVYQRKGQGHVLYSKGRNGRDDQASIDPMTSKPARGFTDCADIVWPQAAEAAKMNPTP